MEDSRFDGIAKSLASPQSRRTVVAGALAALGASVSPKRAAAKANGKCQPGKRCHPHEKLCADAGLVCGPDRRLSCGDSPETLFCGGECVTPGCHAYTIEDGDTFYGVHVFDPETCSCCRPGGVPCAGCCSEFPCCNGCDPDTGMCL